MHGYLKTTMASAAALGLLMLTQHAVLAAGSADPNWPCVQRKVPEITAGIVWSGPEINEDDRSWKEDPALKEMVQKLAQRRLNLDDAKQEVARFAATLTAGKTSKLTLLFAGLLQTIAGERRDVMSGIERYAKRQHALARRINDDRHELTALLKGDTLNDEQIKRRDALEEKLSWDTRIFDERQQSLTYVCEAPVLLEQRLFALGRKILEFVE